MLIIMAVRGRFGLRLFLSPENTSAAQFRRRIVVEMFAPDPLLPQNKLETKKAATLNFSMCGCPCMVNIVSDIFEIEKDAKCVFIAITFCSS